MTNKDDVTKLSDKDLIERVMKENKEADYPFLVDPNDEEIIKKVLSSLCGYSSAEIEEMVDTIAESWEEK